jgi:hypothetical protein
LLAGDRVSTALDLLSAEDGRRVRQFRVTSDAHGLFLAGGEDLLILAGGRLRRERCADGLLRWSIPRPGNGNASGPFAVAPDGRTVAAALGGNEVTLLDGDTGEVWCSLVPPDPGNAVALRFSQDGRHLGVATANHSAVLWDLAEVRSGLRELKLDWPAPALPPSVPVEAVAFAPIHPRQALTNATSRTALLDLSRFATHTLPGFWSGSPENNLTGLRSGRMAIDGIEFDVRAVIQLGNEFIPGLPRGVTGIPVRRTCEHIHFLHASTWDGAARGEIGRYTVVYSDGSTEVIPLIHGENIHDWWIDPANPPALPPVWRGSNPIARAAGRSLALFHLGWRNPHPDRVVESLSFETSSQTRLPFLVAVTAE